MLVHYAMSVFFHGEFLRMNCGCFVECILQLSGSKYRSESHADSTGGTVEQGTLHVLLTIALENSPSWCFGKYQLTLIVLQGKGSG